MSDDDDRARHLINVAAEAAQAGSLHEARGLLQRALATGPSVELRVRAWRTLADVTDDPAEKRECLENILLADPTDGLAQRDLAVLNGTLDPDDIIDPNRVSDGRDRGVAEPLGQDPSAALKEQMFTPATCPACGAGQMLYSPTAGALVCSHCGTRRPLTDRPMAEGHAAAPVRDFAVAMWTAKARRVPTAQPLLKCGQCGAGFVVKPGELSTRCFYCGSTATIQPSEGRDLLLPDAILPLNFTREEALRTVESVMDDETGSGLRERDVLGGYVPVWLLTFGGHIAWSGTARKQMGEMDRQPETVRGTYTMSELVVPVFGTSRLHERIDIGPPQIDVNQAVPFNEEYLTGFPAESYDITLEQAAVAARPVAIDKTRAEVVASTTDEAVAVEISTNGLGIETFTLLLAPIWMTPMSGDRPPLVLNACTGQLYSRRQGLFDRLRRSLGLE